MDDDYIHDSDILCHIADYRQKWVDLLCEDVCASRYKGLTGQLHDSYYRSIYWRRYLKCLPQDSTNWTKSANEARQKYQAVIDKYEINPRHYVIESDLHTNHPLSYSSESVWNKHFQNKSLKISIKQDVIRTFPEVQFFRSEHVQKMMINILFYYAQEHPDICYRQGMHELLAPIVYVIQKDQEIYLELSKLDNLPVEIGILLNSNYMEHDAFQLFCQLMEVIEVWYVTQEVSKQPNQHVRKPFSRQLDSTQNNGLGIKLIKIYENHLKRHDDKLYDHLIALDIAPQIYGIRWLRLLFGREFLFEDVLILWDAIFANDLSFDFVENVFTAMLINIEKQLLESDYNSCLNILMHYPKVNNIQDILNRALKLMKLKETKTGIATLEAKSSSPEGSSFINTIRKNILRKKHSNSDLKNNNLIETEISKNVRNTNFNETTNIDGSSQWFIHGVENKLPENFKNGTKSFKKSDIYNEFAEAKEMMPVSMLSFKNLKTDIYVELLKLKAVNTEYYIQMKSHLEVIEKLGYDKLCEKLKICDLQSHFTAIDNLLNTSLCVLSEELNLDHASDVAQEMKNNVEVTVIEKASQLA